jgi:N-glycosylase/DNA lyase
MHTINLSCDQQFSLDQTLGCGQVFRWDRADNGWWFGVVDRHVIKIRQNGPHLAFEGATVPFITDYFSLDMDLQSIVVSFNRDPFIDIAVRRCAGLRLIRQPGWECLISYICSTNSNIPMIRRRIMTIAERYGTKIFFEGKTYYAFPEPSAIACPGREQLESCKLGYRTPYVFNTACAISTMEQWEETITSMSFEAARRELMKLSGVGPKAADCILLFAFQKYESFPVDVWIRRIMQQHYIRTLKNDVALTCREYDLIRWFARKHFGEFCGYAQEYLYAARRG